MLLDASPHRSHHLEIDAEQIVAAHAGLARHPRRHDADIGPLNGFIGVGAGQTGVEPFNRPRLGDIQGFPLRKPLRDIENHDIPQLFQCRQMGQRAADHAAADQRNFLPGHVWNSS